LKTTAYQYPKNPVRPLHDLKADIQQHSQIDYELLLSEPTNRIFTSEQIYRLQNAFTSYPTLRQIADSMRGIEGYKYQYKATAPNTDWLPFFTGQVYRYIVTRNEVKYVDFSQHISDADYLTFFKGERILLRRIISRRNRLQAMVVNDDFVEGKDLYSILITDDGYDIKYVLATLNSTLISYLYYMRSTVAQKDDFRQTTLEEIRQLPMVRADPKVQQEIATYVDRLVNVKSELQKLAFKDNVMSYCHAQPIGEMPLSSILRWNQLTPGSQKRILDKQRRRGLISKIEILEKADWLTFVVSGKEKPQEKEFAGLPLFSVNITEPTLRRYITSLLSGRKSISATKHTVLDAVLSLKLPKFAPSLRGNISEIGKIVEAYETTLSTHQKLIEQMRELEAQIDSNVFLAYQVSTDSAKVIMENLERDTTGADVSDVNIDEDYQNRVLQMMKDRQS